MDERWSCEAYGPDGIDVGALCFFAEQDERACVSKDQCHQMMTAERHQVFTAIQDGATAGDADMAYLAREVTSPDQLLSGDQITEPADPRTPPRQTDPRPPE